MPTLRVKQPLAIVGASTRAAAASAVRAGFQPLAADLFADADLRTIATATRISPYPDGLLDWLRAVEPPAWMYTGALENHPEQVDEMAWIAPLWGNPGDVLARVRSPHELGRVLNNAGLLFPPTQPSSDDLPKDGTWLAKTYRGASGSGVRIFKPEPHVGGGQPTVYQKRVQGIPSSAIFVAAHGEASLVGLSRQLVGEAGLGANEFQYCGSISHSLFPPEEEDLKVVETAERIGSVLAAEFELVGLFGVDLIVSGTQVWTIEVNPRYTASIEIVERASGLALLSLHAAACTESGPISQPPFRTDPTVHGKAILFAKKGITISRELAESYFIEAIKTPWPSLADVPSAGTEIKLGRPVLSVFAEGESADDVEFRLRERVAEIENQIYEN